MRPLDVGKSRGEELPDPADVRRHIVNRLLLSVHLGVGCTTWKDRQD
jgi:hypothetical protein